MELNFAVIGPGGRSRVVSANQLTTVAELKNFLEMQLQIRAENQVLHLSRGGDCVPLDCDYHTLAQCGLSLGSVVHLSATSQPYELEARFCVAGQSGERGQCYAVRVWTTTSMRSLKSIISAHMRLNGAFLSEHDLYHVDRDGAEYKVSDAGSVGHLLLEEYAEVIEFVFRRRASSPNWFSTALDALSRLWWP